MKSNSAMNRLLAAVGPLPPLCLELKRIADEGFNGKDDCFFLTALLRKAGSVTRSRFYDRTGYECFVNSLHIEDYDNRAPLEQAIQFVSYVFGAWQLLGSSVSLVAVVNVDEFGVIVRFHSKRPTEQWLSDNIEAYSDPTMSVESHESLAAIFQHSQQSG
ncbi:hypothetical protein CAL26_15905 [Bordetella genomosp. 9]|uniref:Uncharacterized protein n=1 Tax=Bordetella genomosp. 9 TaxID=1416803 RepID=A0A261R337_9BORD|nr:hypothetical protein CAL26_15905 [Bordetella genomosp. 9]